MKSYIRGVVWAPQTSLTPPHQTSLIQPHFFYYKNVPVPSKESKLSCICMLESIDFASFCDFVI